MDFIAPKLEPPAMLRMRLSFLTGAARLWRSSAFWLGAETVIVSDSCSSAIWYGIILGLFMFTADSERPGVFPKLALIEFRTRVDCELFDMRRELAS
jgi:hypothetical protein